MLAQVRPLLMCFILGAAQANATTLLALDVPGLTKSSTVIVRATVKSVEARWTKDGARIMTDAVMEVSESWKGKPAKVITVMQPGGIVGDIGQIVHGTVKFAVGDEVVVFLEPRGERYLLTGMLQGTFRVEASPDGKAMARQESEGDALLVDPATHQPVRRPAVVMPIEKLRNQVVASSGIVIPAEPNSPGPVKVTP